MSSSDKTIPYLMEDEDRVPEPPRAETPRAAATPPGKGRPPPPKRKRRSGGVGQLGGPAEEAIRLLHLHQASAREETIGKKSPVC